ncbi:glycosyltransferase family 2 protein [Ramlibacter sp.]|uniref:glycosyltransferase family 2 protein n=1 Tax=Ramlibacter sp. TaxID=1917967 RepID=UPI0026211191|nr:glycosyltransferase family 2 protein [Ramlibacter sp.]MDB5957083.1 glycosyltransferase family 2 [Ramlibacter sp.]
MSLTFTIITPCFNSAKTIEHTIRSVREQSYSLVEHVCIDGGSTDGTLEILQRTGVRHISGPDAGIYDAMNKGLSLATGDVVGILNSDDYYADADVLSTVAAAFERDKLDLLHGKVRQIDDAGAMVCEVGRNATPRQMLRRMVAAHPSVFIRRALYQRFGGFSVGFRIAGDYEHLLRLWPKVKRGFLDQVVVEMRVGGASHTSPAASYRESAAAAVLHGRNPFLAALDCLEGLARNYVVQALRARRRRA